MFVQVLAGVKTYFFREYVNKDVFSPHHLLSPSGPPILFTACKLLFLLLFIVFISRVSFIKELIVILMSMHKMK